MSLRLFMYYCAICGGWAALVGWALGRLISPASVTGRDSVRGMVVGVCVALGLSLVDCLWSVSLRRFFLVFVRVAVAVLIGGIGGLVGGLVGSLLNQVSEVFFVFGWALTGLLIGAAIGAFDFLASFALSRNRKGAFRKVLKTSSGGALGGVLGGVIAIFVNAAWSNIKPSAELDWLWSDKATGFVALGMCVGLLVGVAQVILKEAWVRVEAGFRAGREIILIKDQTSVGRAEAADIPLFGDPGVEKKHAKIVSEEGQYVLVDGTAPGGTFVNEERVDGRIALRSGDEIRMGRSILRFYERQKRRD